MSFLPLDISDALDSVLIIHEGYPDIALGMQWVKGIIDVKMPHPRMRLADRKTVTAFISRHASSLPALVRGRQTARRRGGGGPLYCKDAKDLQAFIEWMKIGDGLPDAVRHARLSKLEERFLAIYRRLVRYIQLSLLCWRIGFVLS